MSPTSIAILVNPDPSSHIVYPYTDEAHITKAVGLFAGAGLRKGEAVILVMVKNDFAPVLQGVMAKGFNLAALESSGQLVCCDAEKLLSSFMFNGFLDEVEFKATIGDLIQKAKQTAY